MVSLQCPALCNTHFARCLSSCKGLKKKKKKRRKKPLSGGLRSHSSQGTLISGCKAQALCAPAPPRPRPSSHSDCSSKVPKATCFSREKGTTRSAISVRSRRPRRCPAGEEVSPGKRALSRGSRGRPQRPQRPGRFRPESPGPGFFPRPAQRPPR